VAGLRRIGGNLRGVVAALPVGLPAEPWQRQVLVLAVASFISFTGFTFVIPFMPLYVRELGVVDPQQNALWSGVIFGVSPLLGGLMGPLWGRIADRFGYKRMVQRSLGCFCVLLVLMAFVQDVYQLLGLRVLLGMVGGFGSLAMALASMAAPRERVGRAIAAIQTAQLLSGVGAPFLGGLVADTVGLRPSFFVAAGACGLSFVLFSLGYQERRARVGEGDKPRAAAPLLHLLRLPNFAVMLLMVFGINFIDRSFGPLLALYVDGLGAPRDMIATISGLIISSGAITAAVSANVVARWASPERVRRVLMITLLAGAVCSLPIALATAWWQLLIFRPLLGLLAGGSLTLAFTLGGMTLPREGRAAAFGFLSSAAMIGIASSAPFNGLLAQISLRAIFFFATALYVVLVLALWRGARDPAVAPEAADAPAPAGREASD
jgi:MFS transporter, DHA1 family, multidrug resistance protein